MMKELLEHRDKLTKLISESKGLENINVRSDLMDALQDLDKLIELKINKGETQ